MREKPGNQHSASTIQPVGNQEIAKFRTSGNLTEYSGIAYSFTDSCFNSPVISTDHVPGGARAPPPGILLKST